MRYLDVATHPGQQGGQRFILLVPELPARLSATWRGERRVSQEISRHVHLTEPASGNRVTTQEGYIILNSCTTWTMSVSTDSKT